MSACSRVQEHVNNLSTGLGAERGRRKGKEKCKQFLGQSQTTALSTAWLGHD